MRRHTSHFPPTEQKRATFASERALSPKLKTAGTQDNTAKAPSERAGEPAPVEVIVKRDECPPSHFWLCVAIWIIIFLGLRMPFVRNLADLEWWQKFLALPLAMAVGLLLFVFSIAGYVIPAQYIEQTMSRSRYSFVRDRADWAVGIWICIVIVTGLWLLPSAE